MSKGILVFTLPDEKDEFELAQSAGKLYSVVWDINAWLRSELKHTTMSKAKAKAMEEFHDRVLEIINEHGVEI